MNTQPLSISRLLASALTQARSAPGLEVAMAAYARRSFGEAESLLLVAGHAGHPNAQEILGFLYAIGPDLYPDIWRRLDAAKNWFERAATGGQPVAQQMHAAFARYGTLEVREWIISDFDPRAAARRAADAANDPTRAEA